MSAPPITVEVARGQRDVARLPQHRAAARRCVEDPAAVSLVLERDDEATALSGGAELGLREPAQQRLVDATLRYADLDEVVVVAETSRRGSQALLVQRCAGIPARCSAVIDVGFETAGLAARRVPRGRHGSGSCAIHRARSASAPGGRTGRGGASAPQPVAVDGCRRGAVVGTGDAGRDLVMTAAGGGARSLLCRAARTRDAAARSQSSDDPRRSNRRAERRDVLAQRAR
jgi:hypothetical protein